MDESPFDLASLRSIYQRLFTGSSSAEMPAYEAKRFFLTADELERHHEKIIETMAAIANRGAENGIIMCCGRGDPGVPIDPERLDSKMRAVIGPAIFFTMQRTQIEEQVVDLIVIPRSRNRPHVMRDRQSNRYYIPIRGAANNATAARHELDEMIRDSMVDSLRRAYPQFNIDERDSTLAYAQEIGYGLDPE